MRKHALLALSLLAAAAASAAEYKASSNGPFLVVAQHGGFSENVVSVRKSGVLSVHINARSVVLTTTAVEVVRESADGRGRKLERSVAYAFDANSDSDAKRLFDTIMRELADSE